MADNFDFTPGSGATGASDVVGTVHYPRVKIVWGADGTVNDADIASGKPLPVQLRDSSGNADPLNVCIGNPTDARNVATDATALSAINVLKQISYSAQALATSIGGNLDLGAGAVGANTQRVTLGTDDATAVHVANLDAHTTSRAFSATFSTLTRPANVTPYSAGDSISDNATAGSVTALVATVSDTNDDLVILSEIKIISTDTGLSGKRIRAYIFNSNPTANSGVGAGDNVAYSQKIAGYVGSFSGTLETGFSDGAVGRLIPTFNDASITPAGGYMITMPSAGGKTIWIQFQAIDAFTPSANSTTIIARAKGLQYRAA